MTPVPPAAPWPKCVFCFNERTVPGSHYQKCPVCHRSIPHRKKVTAADVFPDKNKDLKNFTEEIINGIILKNPFP